MKDPSSHALIQQMVRFSSFLLLDRVTFSFSVNLCYPTPFQVYFRISFPSRPVSAGEAWENICCVAGAGLCLGLPMVFSSESSTSHLGPCSRSAACIKRSVSALSCVLLVIPLFLRKQPEVLGSKEMEARTQDLESGLCP